MDPDAFRRSLNATIQELRNVSWLVQKEKTKLPKFDVWYIEWQREVSADPVMQWIVKSRNRIVKEGDLNLLSRMTARYHLDWVASGELGVEFPPRTPLLTAARSILDGMGSPPFGLVTVTRRWMDYALPGRELLHALSIAYTHCVRLVEMAHQATPASDCAIDIGTRECGDNSERPACMTDAIRYTQVSIDAASGEINVMRHLQFPHADEEGEDGAQILGDPTRYAELLVGNDAIGAVDAFLEAGRQILAVTDDLMMLVVYFHGADVIHMEGGKPDDHYGKVLWADSIASTAINRGATSVLLSADSWVARATDTRLDLLPVAERSDRREALSIHAAANDGRLLSKMLPYERQRDGSASFGDAEASGGIPNLLEPLRKAWGISQWIDVGVSSNSRLRPAE